MKIYLHKYLSANILSLIGLVFIFIFLLDEISIKIPQLKFYYHPDLKFYSYFVFLLGLCFLILNILLIIEIIISEKLSKMLMKLHFNNEIVKKIYYLIFYLGFIFTYFVYGILFYQLLTY